ncbi:MAG: AraC family transcriptional regulator ligand-binding domain-containing protein [Polyangiales bacterium]
MSESVMMRSVAGTAGMHTLRSPPTFILQGVWDELLRRGVSPDELTRRSGVTRPRRGDYTSTMSGDEVHRLFEAAIDLTREPNLGLSIGRALGVWSFHLIGHLLAASRSLPEALALIPRAGPREGRRFPVLADDGDGRLRWGFDDPDSVFGPGAVFEVQLSAVLMHDVALQFFLRPEYDAPAVRFPFAAPSDLGPYARAFPGVLRFEAGGTYVVFPHAALIRRRLGADPVLLQRLFELAREQYSGLSSTESWTTRVRRVLAVHRAPRLADASEVAAQLGTSPRALSRRLMLEGTSFSALLDAMLFERACTLLRQREATIADVSEALGYAELSSFFRAFRRWSGGLTPTVFRRQ